MNRNRAASTTSRRKLSVTVEETCLREEKKRHDKLGKEGNIIGMKFTLVPEAEFMMRSEKNKSEKPVHEVIISKPFYLETHPVTQREWKAVMGDNSGGKTHPVGQKKPNSWGLYNMHGNIWEWGQDKWHGDYKGASTDGCAWEIGDGSNRVLRGGGWHFNAQNCRSAIRISSDPGLRCDYLGFRLLQES